MKRLAEEQFGIPPADSSQRRRRRLMQEADLQPAAALMHPAPTGTLPLSQHFVPVPGSSLMQALEGCEGSPPKVKPGGRRKRAAQAQADLDAASLLLSAVSQIQSAPDGQVPSGNAAPSDIALPGGPACSPPPLSSLPIASATVAAVPLIATVIARPTPLGGRSHNQLLDHGPRKPVPAVFVQARAVVNRAASVPPLPTYAHARQSPSQLISSSQQQLMRRSPVLRIAPASRASPTLQLGQPPGQPPPSVQLPSRHSPCSQLCSPVVEAHQDQHERQQYGGPGRHPPVSGPSIWAGRAPSRVAEGSRVGEDVARSTAAFSPLDDLASLPASLPASMPCAGRLSPSCCAPGGRASPPIWQRQRSLPPISASSTSSCGGPLSPSRGGPLSPCRVPGSPRQAAAGHVTGQRVPSAGRPYDVKQLVARGDPSDCMPAERFSNVA